MTINLTRPTAVLPVVPVPAVDPRDALMRAFSVAESVASRLADRPTSITLTDGFNGAYSIEIYFHDEPEQVARFAAQHGVETQAGPHYGDDSSTYTSADAMIDGVKVRGWALTRAEAVAA